MNKKAKKYNSDILNVIFSEITSKEQKRTDNRMLLSAKIKNGMNAKGLKNKQLAGALNQQPSVITKWLSGTHNFTSDTLSDIEEVLGIKLLALEDKKEQQVANYQVKLSATVVNDPDKGRLKPRKEQYQDFNITTDLKCQS
jgi:transcriptional regulator with XRE-family HTH domain